MHGQGEIVSLMLKAESPLSVVNREVNKPSVKLKQSNIELFK
jgi:hypothetical protein